MPATATVLEIAKNVAASIGFQPPDTLRSNQDPNSRLLLSLINRGGRVLASKRGPFGESWVELGPPACHRDGSWPSGLRPAGRIRGPHH